MRTPADMYYDALRKFESNRDNIIKVRGEKIIEIVDYQDYFDADHAYPDKFRGKSYFKVGNLKIYKKWLVSELITEFTGENPPLMQYWSTVDMKNFAEVLDDGIHTYTYGERWLTFKEIDGVVKRMLNDPYTRQAVLITHAPWDPYYSSWYVPCTMYHQFLYRNNKLDVLLYMRSWDMNRGFKYDPYLALFLGQYMCAILNKNNIPCTFNKVRVHAGSFHIYMNDLDKVNMDNYNSAVSDKFKSRILFVLNQPELLRDELRTIYFASAVDKRLNTVVFRNVFSADAYHILRGDFNVASF